MSRPLALLALAISLVSLPAPIKAAEPDTPAPSNTSGPQVPSVIRRYRKLSPEQEERFKARVTAGDRALEAGRLNQAVDAYDEALRIKYDPRLSGRLGLVLSMFLPDPETDVDMAFLLQDAVSEAAGISTTERKQFFDAYERVRKRVCRLDIWANAIEATVVVRKRKPVKPGGGFWTFIPPGQTEVIASLNGRDDIKKVADCKPGNVPMQDKSILLVFEFPKAEGETPQVITIEKEPKERVIVRELRPPLEYRERVPPSTQDKKPSSHFNGGVGPVIIFGAAPSSSLGFSITGQYRGQGLNAIAIAKGAWSLGGLADPPVSFFSGAAVVGPCAQWQWLDACAFVGATFFEYRLSPNPSYKLDTHRDLIPSLGLGLGATFRIGETLTARVFADATALTRDMEVNVIASDNSRATVWQTQRLLFSVSASLMFGR